MNQAAIILGVAGAIIVIVGWFLGRMGRRDLGNQITALAADFTRYRLGKEGIDAAHHSTLLQVLNVTATDLDLLKRKLSVQLGGAFTHPPPISQDSNASVALEATPPAADAAAGGQAEADTDSIVHIAHDNGTAFPDLTAHRPSELAALNDDKA